ncbi:hypothetical protein C3747_202g85c [Trypanosoma cruzi]|uniref:Uncharacterized protein n=2 Tax=Trypanosoma cruzi TaxID=5693 RepID=Q4DW23_TRYCC|nr:hypothetical protein, conserved [Trypanosoma cruzi]XP_820177.1 hypothetical protein, conserved [Trypanosoma cruzi]EAN96729.1 hypothetical protein, conserved [Trypanosoma cruzi]EAN98326.1 hypothetical protein, conserved [Trypanosoma cruzi]KAF8300290.1 hypothetical protein TcYC6_0061680 [Trypanosoma cruzi]PWU99226.1 hypothetical protein C3747_221g50c [Trypanosoma cruzi]PWV00938.1 hypothetical protein C3747_202g85c [Trypanosoma cruzi]|eukprot:XP_818580.1 hypothetical protein [Trypanosoma cruzi strain CL Brener]
MPRRRQRNRYDFQRSFDSLKNYYGFPLFSRHSRHLVYSLGLTPYSRRNILSEYRIIGSSREQVVLEVMQTYTPTAPTQQVCDRFLEVAALLSLYYDAVDVLHQIPKG